MKTCKNCQKTTDDFYARSAMCRPCDKQKRRTWYEANKESVKAKVKAWVQANPARRREYARVWANSFGAKNPSKISEKNRKWNTRNPEKRTAATRSWQLANPERIKDWRTRNAEKLTAQDARRRALKLCAMPQWAEPEIIELIYTEAKHRGMEVDHIIPLQGKTVCGLHIHTNLQLLSRSENRKKSNTFKAVA